MKSETIGKLALALSKAQAKIIGAVKDSSNPFYKSKYANLEAVMDAIRVPFADNELSYVQPIVVIDSLPYVKTILMHSSGEYIESIYPVIAKEMNDAQKVGGGVTYARRYALAAIAGVPQIDDDAEAAVGRNHEEKSVEKKPLPNFAPKTQVEPKGNEEHLKKLVALVSKSKLSNEQISQMIKLRFKKNSAKDLLPSELEEVISTVEASIELEG